MTVGLDSVERGLHEIAAGRPVVVVDDEHRENEGDLLFAACKATPELLAFTIRHTSGVVCVAMPAADLDRLHLPPMTAVNEDPKGTAYAVSVDAREGVTTGISAADRARTVALLGSPETRPGDLSRPGHVFPLRAVQHGVLHRPGHTEAAVDLARLAGLSTAGAIAEIVDEDGSMARLPALRRFARRHGLAIVSIAALIDYRWRHEKLVERVVDIALPTRHGRFRAVGFRCSIDGAEHVAMTLGDVRDESDRGVLVRVHSECLTGDVFGSVRCDCGAQRDDALAAVAAAGAGVVVYLRGHEGRGIGLLNKLRAHALQDHGLDRVGANQALELPVDARDYLVAAQILADLGVRRARLLTNNPQKVSRLRELGLDVMAQVHFPAATTADNLHYLQTKRDRMEHRLTVPDPGAARGWTWPASLLQAPTVS